MNHQNNLTYSLKVLGHSNSNLSDADLSRFCCMSFLPKNESTKSTTVLRYYSHIYQHLSLSGMRMPFSCMIGYPVIDQRWSELPKNEKVALLIWPGNSPDLNHKESAYLCPDTISGCHKSMEIIWKVMDRSCLEEITKAVPRHLQEVIHRKEKMTKYVLEN